MAGNHWLRLWHDMPNDPKWRTVSRISGQPISLVLSTYVHLLVAASQSVKRGVTHCNAEDVASALDCDKEQVEAVLKAMQGRVLDGDRLTGWESRQPQREDNSTDRVKKHRETQSNAMKRNETLDKDKEEIKIKNIKTNIPEWVPIESWNGFAQMRNRIKAPLTPKAISLSIKELAKLKQQGHEPGAVLDQSTMRGWRGLFAINERQSNGTNQPVNRSRARQDAQRDELRRAEEMDSQGTFDAGDHDEGNGDGRSLKRLCESVGGPAQAQVAKGIPRGSANPEILPKASRTY